MDSGEAKWLKHLEEENRKLKLHACRLLELSRSTYRYRVRNPERDMDLRARLKELAAKRMCFGYRRLTVMLAGEGILANHKRVYRLYREKD